MSPRRRKEETGQLEVNSEMSRKLMMLAAVTVAFGAWAYTETVGGFFSVFALLRQEDLVL